jgi:hypothetical protein
VWESTVDGRQLRFRLFGINNQNFIMRDEETGSWWQQVSGEAILGPLKGKRLKGVMHDELTFATWKAEQPTGRVLKPDPAIVAKGEYAPADWEQRINRLPVATRLSDNTLPMRELIAGIKVGGAARAYPVSLLKKQNPIVDEVAGKPLILVLGEDGKSVRVFESLIDGQKTEFFLKPATSPLRLTDSATQSEWDFTGKAVSGPSMDKQLRQVYVLLDYWFDWKTYNPETSVYKVRFDD